MNNDVCEKESGNDLVAIHKRKVALKLNKATHVEMYILNSSKVLIYEFHYDYIKNLCSSNCRL